MRYTNKYGLLAAIKLDFSNMTSISILVKELFGLIL